MVERLLTAKADVNDEPAEHSGRTTLQAAAKNGHLEVVERLLTAKADVNAESADYFSRTALQAAAESGHFEVVERLLIAKAALEDTRKALWIAESNGDERLIKLLESAVPKS